MDTMLADDIERLRRETRGCEEVVHFNNAGASLMPAPVVDTMIDYLRSEELSGGYETAEREHERLERFYGATASLLNCNPTEIAYVENATRAWDMAFYSLRFGPGDRILTTIAEYGSNVIAYNQQAARHGVEIVFVPNDEHGQIDVDALSDLIDERTRLISISHIPTGGGLVNPAVEVGRVARSAGVPYLLDACQSVGQIPVDVEDIGCDLLSGTGRKYLRGPRATGLLYVREGILESLEPPFLDQHAADLVNETRFTMRPDARRFENWEQNFAGKAALAVAIDYALAIGLASIRERIYMLASRLRRGLAEIPGVRVTDEGREQCGIVTFVADAGDATEIKRHLRDGGFNVTVSSGSGNLVSFRRRGLDEVVRASVHYFNTEDEVDVFLEAIQRLLRT